MVTSNRLWTKVATPSLYRCAGHLARSLEAKSPRPMQFTGIDDEGRSGSVGGLVEFQIPATCGLLFRSCYMVSKGREKLPVNGRHRCFKPVMEEN
jgi:hypothetical protein